MPTYDYECLACQHRYELFQSITAKPVRKCPACGKNRANRLIGTGASVIFKGSGFYETDYRSDSYKKAAKADGDAGKATGDKTKKEGTDAAAPSKAAGDSAPATPPAPRSTPAPDKKAD